MLTTVVWFFLRNKAIRNPFLTAAAPLPSLIRRKPFHPILSENRGEISTMEESKTSDRLSVFLDSGIYRFENSNVVFIDPVRVLNLSYNRHRVSPTAYYSRFFHSKCSGQDRHETKLSSSSKKRKRREKKPHSLNERERAADQRHRASIFNYFFYYWIKVDIGLGLIIV